MRCQLCYTYYHADRAEEKVQIGKNKEITVINRFCKHREIIVNADDDGCEKFSPCKYFWCPGWESWASFKECQHRQAKDKYRSCPCSIGIEVTAILELPQKKQMVIRKPKKQLIIRKT